MFFAEIFEPRVFSWPPFDQTVIAGECNRLCDQLHIFLANAVARASFT
jgi:hypothetical protein